jgi:hypothetical protein
MGLLDMFSRKPQDQSAFYDAIPPGLLDQMTATNSLSDPTYGLLNNQNTAYQQNYPAGPQDLTSATPGRPDLPQAGDTPPPSPNAPEQPLPSLAPKAPIMQTPVMPTSGPESLTDQQRKYLAKTYKEAVGNHFMDVLLAPPGQVPTMLDKMQKYNALVTNSLAEQQQAQTIPVMNQFRQEMMAAGGSPEALKKVVGRYSGSLGADMTNKYMDAIKAGYPQNEVMDKPFAGADGNLYQMTKNGTPIPVKDPAGNPIKAPKQYGAISGGIYDTSAGPGSWQSVGDKASADQAYDAALEQTKDAAHPNGDPLKAYGLVEQARQKAANPKAVTMTDLYIRAANGDPVAQKAVKLAKPGPEGSHAMMIGPDGVAFEVRPGTQVPTGSLTTSGVNTSNVVTSNTRTMMEAAPKVLGFVSRIQNLLDENEKQLGPLDSRWNDFTAGKIGLPNKGYTQLKTDAGLLATSLMRMHVGARGSEKIMEHFQNMIDVAHQSPANLRAALDEIKNYATEVAAQNTGVPPPTAGVPAIQPGAVQPPPGSTPPLNLLQEGVNTPFKNGQVWTKRNGQAVRVK